MQRLASFAALLWMAVIFGTSCRFISRDAFLGAILPLIPGEGTRHYFTLFWDNLGGLIIVKGYHAAEFALLFLLCRAGLVNMFHFAPRRAARIAVLFCILYAASDEWHQTFVPGRGGTWVDVVIDSGGIILALICVGAWGRRRREMARISAEMGNPGEAD